MPIPFLVEGDTDEAFFNSLFKIEQLADSYEVFNCEGQENLDLRLPSLVEVSIRRICLAKDINKGDENSIYEHYKSLLESKFSTPIVFRKGVFRVAKSIVSIIPLGLEDDTLRSLGIQSQALDDFMVKILLTDDSLVQAISKGKIESSTKLKEMLSTMIEELRKYKVDIVSSKELLELVKASMHYTFSPAKFASILIEKTERSNLNNIVSPILNRLRQLVEI